MAEGEAPRPGTQLLPYAGPEPALGSVSGLVRRVSDLGLGAASLLATAAVGAVERFVPGEPAPNGEVSLGVVHLVPGALLGAGLSAQRRLLDATAAAERAAARVTRVAARAPVIGASMKATEEYLAGWGDRGERAQAQNRALVTSFVRGLAPELATAVVAQLDVEGLVGQLPIDAVLEGVDLNALLERIDVNALLERIDIDRIMQRVDVDALMSRVDIVPIAQEVVAEVDIASIVRASTGTIGGDTRDGVRITAMRVDGFMGKVADRILLRRRARDLSIPEYDPAALEDAREDDA